MSCARNQILQMLVRLTGPPRPRVSAAALNSSPILTEQIIMGTMRYSRIEPAVHPTEVVFQTGFPNGEFFRQQTHGDMFPEICGEDLFCFFGDPHLKFRIKAAGF